MRSAAIACAAMMAACTTEFGITDDTTTQDTAVDTTQDTVVPDVPVDTTPADTYTDPTTDPVPDTYTDPWVDPEPDGTTCFPTTPEGACNIVEQCGCPDEQRCGWTVNADYCDISEVCMDGSAGELGVERTCFSEDDCAPGLQCISTGAGAGYCLQWCRDDSDCAIAGRPCALSFLITWGPPCGEITPSLRMCGTGECMEEGCNLWDPTSCPGGETCAWDKLCDVLYCTPAGEAGTGEECWSQYCMPGTMCMMNSDGVARCAQFCQLSEDCPGGMACYGVGSEAHGEVMVCM